MSQILYMLIYHIWIEKSALNKSKEEKVSGNKNKYVQRVFLQKSKLKNISNG